MRQHKSNPKPHVSVSIKSRAALKFYQVPLTKQQVKPEESQRRLEREDEHRLLVVNHKTHQLELGDHFARQFPVTRRGDHPSFISFLGTTGSGKSFILRALKKNDGAEAMPEEDGLDFSFMPAIAQPKDLTSTTGEICAYPTRLDYKDNEPIYFWDC